MQPDQAYYDLITEEPGSDPNATRTVRVQRIVVTHGMIWIQLPPPLPQHYYLTAAQHAADVARLATRTTL